MQDLSSRRCGVPLKAILVIWVAYFAPLYCQYHGLLLGTNSAEQHRVYIHHTAHATGCHHTATSDTVNSALIHHDTSGRALTVAVAMIAAPVPLRFAAFQPAQSVVLPRVSLPAACALPPPDQPPRHISVSETA
jgi:hypothetical protein